MSLNVIRGFLGASQLQSPELRVDGGVIQRTYDGGTTWTDSPLDDPRTNPAGVRERTTVSTTRCDSAARMVHALHDEFDTFLAAANALEFAVNLMGILAAIVGTGLTGFIAILFDIVLGGGYALFAIGQSTLSAAFTSTVWDNLVCTLYCFVEADGTITQAGVDSFYAKVQADYSSTVYNALIELGNLLGWVLLSDAYLEYGDTGSCGGCTACTWTEIIYPADTDKWEWYQGTVRNCSGVAQVDVAGNGTIVSDGGVDCWKGYTPGSNITSFGLAILVYVPPTSVITSIEFHVKALHGVANYDGFTENVYANTGTACHAGTGSPVFGISGRSISGCQLIAGLLVGSSTSGKWMTFDYVTVTGTGVNPFL